MRLMRSLGYSSLLLPLGGPVADPSLLKYRFASIFYRLSIFRGCFAICQRSEHAVGEHARIGVFKDPELEIFFDARPQPQVLAAPEHPLLDLPFLNTNRAAVLLEVMKAACSTRLRWPGFRG
jgi:hypothetical protein